MCIKLLLPRDLPRYRRRQLGSAPTSNGFSTYFRARSRIWFFCVGMTTSMRLALHLSVGELPHSQACMLVVVRGRHSREGTLRRASALSKWSKYASYAHIGNSMIDFQVRFRRRARGINDEKTLKTTSSRAETTLSNCATRVVGSTVFWTVITVWKSMWHLEMANHGLHAEASAKIDQQLEMFTFFSSTIARKEMRPAAAVNDRGKHCSHTNEGETVLVKCFIVGWVPWSLIWHRTRLPDLLWKINFFFSCIHYSLHYFWILSIWWQFIS